MLLIQSSQTAKGKDKGFPLQAWSGCWGSRRLMLLDLLDFRPMKVVRSSPLRTGRLHPQEFSWYSFLEAESTPGHMVSSVASEKIPSDTTGDRFRDPPTSRAVPYHYATPGPFSNGDDSKMLVQVCWPTSIQCWSKTDAALLNEKPVSFIHFVSCFAKTF
jgi:hypothetical protein